MYSTSLSLQPQPAGDNLPAEVAELYEAELAKSMGTGFVPMPIAITIEHRRRVFTAPDGEEIREIRGVILHSQINRGYWEPGEKRPVCFSGDGAAGTDAAGQTHTCAKCAKNQFGSRQAANGKAKGKACKEMRRLLILPDGYSLPIIVTVPPTSLRNFDRYASTLATRKKIPLSAVATLITLEKAESGGNEFARMVFEKIGVLPPEEFIQVIKVRDEVLGGIDLGQISEEEMEEPMSEGEGGGPDLAEIDF